MANTILDSFQVNMLKKMYPGLSNNQVENILGIRGATQEFLKSEGEEHEMDFSSFEQYMDQGDLGKLNEQFYKVAGKEGDILKVLLGDMYNPSASDTISYHIDPEAFENIDVGDMMKGLSMFNVMYGGKKVNEK